MLSTFWTTGAWLVHWTVCLCCDSLELLLLFWFYDTQLKIALLITNEFLTFVFFFGFTATAFNGCRTQRCWHLHSRKFPWPKMFLVSIFSRDQRTWMIFLEPNSFTEEMTPEKRQQTFSIDDVTLYRTRYRFWLAHSCFRTYFNQSKTQRTRLEEQFVKPRTQGFPVQSDGQINPWIRQPNTSNILSVMSRKTYEMSSFRLKNNFRLSENKHDCQSLRLAITSKNAILSCVTWQNTPRFLEYYFISLV